jgi:PknH-like extracellular domain
VQRRRAMIAALSACVVLAGCAAAETGTPVVHFAEAVKPSEVRALDQVLPTLDEMAVLLGSRGVMGQLVEGGADMLLAGVSETEATPVDCVSPTYRLQKVVYQASPIRAVASQAWAGGSFDGPPVSGFFGVVRFATPDDAQAFFAATAEKWHRCNGQTLVLHQPARGADGTSRITEVSVDRRMVSAVVMHDAGSTTQRALGVAADCVVDVEISNADPGSASGAVGVTNLMLQKIGIS